MTANYVVGKLLDAFDNNSVEVGILEDIYQELIVNSQLRQEVFEDTGLSKKKLLAKFRKVIELKERKEQKV